VPGSLFSRFTYSSWNGTSSIWKDLVGRNNNTIGINLSTTCITGANGARGKVCELGGAIDSVIDFGEAALPAVYTLCTVSRYSGSNKQRIFAGSTSEDWFHGHANGRKGVAYYNEWMTGRENDVPTNDTDWVIFCGQNSAPWRFLANGGSVETADPKANANGGIKIGVNMCLSGWSSCKVSDFAIMEVAIWNRSLLLEELVAMHKFYSNMLSTSNLGNKLMQSFSLPRLSTSM
jgi:hypothetical protein